MGCKLPVGPVVWAPLHPGPAQGRRWVRRKDTCVCHVALEVLRDTPSTCACTPAPRPPTLLCAPEGGGLSSAPRRPCGPHFTSCEASMEPGVWGTPPGSPPLRGEQVADQVALAPQLLQGLPGLRSSGRSVTNSLSPVPAFPPHSQPSARPARPPFLSRESPPPPGAPPGCAQPPGSLSGECSLQSLWGPALSSV